MLFLLDLQLGAILESPLDDVRLLGGSLHPLALLQLRPPLGELGQLDQVPDIAEVGLDDGGLLDGGGSGDGHFD